MNDAILIQIRPEQAAKTLNGEQTIIILKTAPKDWMDYLSGKTKKKPEPRTAYICCTKSSCEKLHKNKNGWFVNEMDTIFLDGVATEQEYNGKVVAKFVLNSIRPSHWSNAMAGSCLTPAQINEYLKGKTEFYGWCVSDLVIFDEPKEIGQFRSTSWCSPNNCFGCPIKEQFYYHPNININENYEECEKQCLRWGLTRAPRSWMYVEELK